MTIRISGMVHYAENNPLRKRIKKRMDMGKSTPNMATLRSPGLKVKLLVGYI